MVHSSWQGAPHTTSSTNAYLINYLCAYTLMVYFNNSPTHPSPHSHTLVRHPPPSTTIAAHLHSLQPPRLHLASAPYTVSTATLSSPCLVILAITPSPASPVQPLSTTTNNPSTSVASFCHTAIAQLSTLLTTTTPSHC